MAKQYAMKKYYLLLFIFYLLTNKIFSQTTGTPEAGYSRCLIYSSTGASQTFTTPAKSVYYVKLWGAGGGGDNWVPVGFTQYGGAGGFAKGSVPLNKNIAVTLIVGKGGIVADGNYTGSSASGVAPYGGGGPGGISHGYGASGGGRSAVRYDVNGNSAIDLPAEEIITAGGGGGASAGTNNRAQQGGPGGGNTGTAGTNTGTAAANNGGAGTQISGGAAGTTGAGGSANGVAGSQFNGGRGGNLGTGGTTDGGGGGGGGWFGGGGGVSITGAGDAPGGGGSSHFAAPITGGSTTAGLLIVPGNILDVHYTAGIGAGGTTGNGGDGRIVIQWNEDHSDAPSSYGDPGHGIPASPAIYLGSTAPDGDTYANVLSFLGLTTATGDESTFSADEEAISSAINIPRSATSYSQTLSVTNTSGANAFLSGWVDYNKNGLFDDSEKATATVANGATSATLTWSSLSGLTFGGSYMRLRISSVAGDVSSPTGTAADGEVEDFPVTFMSPLPVTLINFKTEMEDCNTLLSWATASETNSAHIEVERGNDGAHFAKIATIPTQGNSTTMNTYKTTDNNPLPGTNYYRLKTVDMNGEFTFSDLKLVSNTCIETKQIVTYPNPFSDYLNISFTETGQEKMQLTIRNLMGKIMLTKNLNGDLSALSTFSLDTSPLKSGIYTLKITDEKNNLVGSIQKIIKK